MAARAREREQALAWIASRLRWERTLAELRHGRKPHAHGERQAA